MVNPSGCVLGVDVSAAQRTIDWAKVYAAGARVAFVEIGIGNDTPNPLRVAQVAGARAAGLSVFGYDFAYILPADGIHAGRDPQAQAKLWLSEAKGLGLAGLFVDAEWPPEVSWSKWVVSASFGRGWLLAAFSTLAAAGVEAGLYGAPSFLRAIGVGMEPALAGHPLWLADWGVETPDVPAPWDSWQAWQHTSTGTLDGIAGPVDLSWVRSSGVPTSPDLARAA